MMMSEGLIRPEIVEDEHLEFLDELRESGIVNMFGGRSYLIKEFDLDPHEASKILTYWMESFGEATR